MRSVHTRAWSSLFGEVACGMSRSASVTPIATASEISARSSSEDTVTLDKLDQDACLFDILWENPKRTREVRNTI